MPEKEPRIVLAVRCMICIPELYSHAGRRQMNCNEKALENLTRLAGGLCCEKTFDDADSSARGECTATHSMAMCGFCGDRTARNSASAPRAECWSARCRNATAQSGHEVFSQRRKGAIWRVVPTTTTKSSVLNQFARRRRGARAARHTPCVQGIAASRDGVAMHRPTYLAPTPFRDAASVLPTTSVPFSSCALSSAYRVCYSARRCCRARWKARAIQQIWLSRK